MTKFNKTVIFFPGFMKSSTDFEFTESKKKISICSTIAKQANVYCVNLAQEDYLKPIEEICNRVMNDLIQNDISIKNIILICHSYGGFYGFKFTQLFNDKVKGIMMIDIPLPNDSFKNFLLNQHQDEITQFKLSIFDSYVNDIPLNMPIVILSNNSGDRKEHFQYLVSKCELSKYIEYTNYTHMIHYLRYDVVIENIRYLLKNNIMKKEII